MATLLQHVRPWMQRAIAEFEARVEQRMENMMDQKVQVIHQRLDSFELRVIERSALTVDVTTLQNEIESLRVNVTIFLAPPETELESAPMAPVEDMVLSALFRDGMPSPYSSRISGKRPRSGRTSDDTKAERAMKREHQQMS
uniref:Integrase core domain containing protein n=1 Tax=Solanum tuberosum TaxID=4113 RepID=M1DFF3_SOLTU